MNGVKVGQVSPDLQMLWAPQ